MTSPPAPPPIAITIGLARHAIPPARRAAGGWVVRIPCWQLGGETEDPIEVLSSTRRQATALRQEALLRWAFRNRLGWDLGEADAIAIVSRANLRSLEKTLALALEMHHRKTPTSSPQDCIK